MNTLTIPKEKLVKCLESLIIKHDKMTNDSLKEWFRVGNQIKAIKRMLERGMYAEWRDLSD